MPEHDGEATPRGLVSALGDPGSITPRGDNYKERIIDWQGRAVVIHLGLVRETRIRWEWPEIPEGWRLCENHTFTDAGRLVRTATNAPRNEAPYDYETKPLEARRCEVERWVTPWAALFGSSEQVTE